MRQNVREKYWMNSNFKVVHENKNSSHAVDDKHAGNIMPDFDRPISILISWRFIANSNSF
jgi:hypothetical protein